MTKNLKPQHSAILLYLLGQEPKPKQIRPNVPYHPKAIPWSSAGLLGRPATTSEASTISRRLRSLEEGGFITRHPEERAVRFTRAGRLYAEKLREVGGLINDDLEVFNNLQAAEEAYGVLLVRANELGRQLADVERALHELGPWETHQAVADEHLRDLRERGVFDEAELRAALDRAARASGLEGERVRLRTELDVYERLRDAELVRLQTLQGVVGDRRKLKTFVYRVNRERRAEAGRRVDTFISRGDIR